MVNNEIISTIALLNEQNAQYEKEYQFNQIEISDVARKIKQIESRLGIENDGTLFSKFNHILGNGNLLNYSPKINQSKIEELRKKIEELIEQKNNLIETSKYLSMKIEDYAINKKLILEVYVYIKHEYSNNEVISANSKHKSDVEMLNVYYNNIVYLENGNIDKMLVNQVIRYLPASLNNNAKWINFKTDKVIFEINDKTKYNEHTDLEYMKLQYMINNIQNTNIKKIFQCD